MDNEIISTHLYTPLLSLQKVSLNLKKAHIAKVIWKVPSFLVTELCHHHRHLASASYCRILGSADKS